MVDLHSVINLIGVLYGCIELLQAEMVEGLENAKSRVYRLSEEIKSAGAMDGSFYLDSAFPVILAADIQSAIQSKPAIAEGNNVIELRDTISTVLEVFTKRIVELRERMSRPMEWVRFSAAHIGASIQQVLAAIEQNAHGRYRIVRNIADQTPQDYQFDLSISSTPGNEFIMPPVLQDVLHDLIAVFLSASGGKLSINSAGPGRGATVEAEVKHAK